jgi:imidazolonepropionase-like amidohydrolase
VYPGWIDAASSLGITEPGPGGWYNDISEMLDYNPQLRTRVAWKADSDAIPIARTNGVTAVAAMPSGGTLGGEVPVMNLDGWTWEEATVRPSAGIAFRFPGIGGGGAPFGQAPEGPERTYEDLKKERDKKLDDLAALFDRARAYARAGAGRTTDWILEALVPVVEGAQPLFTAVRSESELKDAVAFAERVKVKIVIGAGPEAALAAPLLSEKGVPLILDSILTLPAHEDMFHAASYQAAGELARAGVTFAFSTGDATNGRLLPYNAAMAVAWGLPRDEALRAMTINAAEILGVADVMGSLEPGKLANLFIAAGDPLEIRTAVTHVFINGRDVGVKDRHYELYEKWMGRR